MCVRFDGGRAPTGPGSCHCPGLISRRVGYPFRLPSVRRLWDKCIPSFAAATTTQPVQGSNKNAKPSYGQGMACRER